MSGGIVSSSLSIIPPDNPVTYTATLTGAGPETIVTVPAGKTLYVTGAAIINTLNTGENYEINVAGTKKLEIQLIAYESITLAGQPVIVATAGQAVTATSSTSGTAFINIWGFLQ